MLQRRTFRWLSPGMQPALLAALVAGLAVAVQAADDKPTDPLPLKKVVLFSSGVGFYEHAGNVNGDAKIDLKFNVQEINDLLKSMVLEDNGGGKISTVTYGSKDPVTKALKTFAIDLTSNPTLADLLAQIRGEKIQIEAQTTVTVGTIVGVEKRKVRVPGKDETIEVTYLNLLTSDGLRSLNLDNVSKIKLVDEKLNAELMQALTILAAGHSTDKKTVSLNFLGKGKRPVRVGYIQESPIWKTSYRLVVKEKDAPLLQGWAIVENTTEQDWNDVALTLISGRPISFRMDMYQPLYVSRPLVEPELYASLRPQVYSQDLASRDREFRKQAEAKSGPAPAAPLAGAAMPSNGMAMAKRKADAAEYVDRGRANTDEQMNIGKGVQSLAQAGDVGEMFKYDISTPVTLPRQQSAMLPIVNESVKAEKVSIYNPAVHPKHPLAGLKLNNSTELHLMQGPITVFDGGAYAGDARIEDLPPGSERLISYAMDLDTEVAPESKGQPEQLVSVKMVKGTLQVARKHQREQLYTIKNSGKSAKKLLIEYNFDSSWKLMEPKEPAEKTRNLYRFVATAEPGKPATLKILEERIDNQVLAITNIDDGTISFYMNTKVISKEAKDALAEVIKRKQAINVTVGKRNNVQNQINAIDQEQNRLRQNMAQLDRNSDLYNRYVKKMTEQEDQVDKLRNEIKGLNEEEQQQRRSLDEYLLKLDV